MTIERCKGSRDFGPDEMAKFRTIEETFRVSCEAWGFKEVRTPVLEYLHLFTSAGTLTPEMLERVYSFLDWDGWSGERVVLRPDNTIPVARMYSECMAHGGPARLYYIGNTFIFEPTGKTNRERWQCGAEFIGSRGSTADGELIMLSMETLYQLGIEEIELKLSHAGIIKAILRKASLSPEDEARIFDELLNGNAESLSRLKNEKPEAAKVVSTLLRVKGNSPVFLGNLKSILVGDIPEIQAAIDDFIAIVTLLEELGLKYQIDVTSGREFEYYTGVMFQLFIKGVKVGGGGRYDNLIPQMGGGNTPASGFALYMDPLMAIATDSGEQGNEEPRVGVLVKSGGEKTAFDTADTLRDAGYIVELCYQIPPAEKVPWLVNVAGGGACTLMDTRKSVGFEAEDTAKLLELLEEKIHA